jgi:hypothetical protein
VTKSFFSSVQQRLQQPQSSPAWSQATAKLDHICTDLE